MTAEEWALAASAFFAGLGSGLLGMLSTIMRPMLQAMDGRDFRNFMGAFLRFAEKSWGALNPIARLLCLDEFDALSLLRHAGHYGVYLQSQEHHKSRQIEPEHEDYHRPEYRSVKVDFKKLAFHARG